MRQYIDQLKRVWDAPGNRTSRVRAALRALGWFVRKRVNSDPVTIQIFGDQKFLCHVDGFVANTVMLFSEWAEYDSLHFMDSFLRPGDHFLDVGTNVGLFTILAAKKIQSGEIVCVEPGIVQRDRLLANLDLNQITADVYPYAVSNQEGEVSFSQGDAIAHISINGESDRQGVVTVLAKRLDTFVPPRRYALVKLDVEGYELPALQGASGLIEKGLFPVILFEINGGGDRYDLGADKVVQHFREIGYTLGVYHHDDQVFDTKAKLWDDVIALNDEGMRLLRERIPGVTIH